MKRINYNYKEFGLSRSHGDDGIGQTLIYEYENKTTARNKTIIDFYKSIFKNQSIPENKQYWCLCAEQTNGSDSEIMQLIQSGLITVDQFFGVDRSKVKIEKNKEKFPKANWFFGDWIAVIKRTRNFNPAIVYLDTLNTAINKKLWRDIVTTMMFCPVKTLLIVNAAINNAYAGSFFKPSDLISGISQEITPDENKKWHDFGNVYTYLSETKRTVMATYNFLKKG